MKSSGIFTLPLYFSIYCLMASLSSEPATCIVIVIQFALFLYIRALLSLVCFYLCDGWRLRLFCHFSLFLRFFYIWDILFSLFSFFILLRIFCQVFHIFCICCYTLAISSIPYFTVSIITYDIPMIMIKGPYATLFHFFRAMVNGLLGVSISVWLYTMSSPQKHVGVPFSSYHPGDTTTVSGPSPQSSSGAFFQTCCTQLSDTFFQTGFFISHSCWLRSAQQGAPIYFATLETELGRCMLGNSIALSKDIPALVFILIA